MRNIQDHQVIEGMRFIAHRVGSKLAANVEGNYRAELAVVNLRSAVDRFIEECRQVGFTGRRPHARDVETAMHDSVRELHEHADRKMTLPNLLLKIATFGSKQEPSFFTTPNGNRDVETFRRAGNALSPTILDFKDDLLPNSPAADKVAEGYIAKERRRVESGEKRGGHGGAGAAVA